VTNWQSNSEVNRSNDVLKVAWQRELYRYFHVYFSETSNKTYATYISTNKIWVAQQDTVVYE